MVSLSVDMWLFWAVPCIFSELKTAFIRTLNLDEEHTIVPENSHLFAAIGSALNSKEDAKNVSLLSMRDRLRAAIAMDFEVDRMEPLFASKEDYQAFNRRRDASTTA